MVETKKIWWMDLTKINKIVHTSLKVFLYSAIGLALFSAILIKFIAISILSVIIMVLVILAFAAMILTFSISILINKRHDRKKLKERWLKKCINKMKQIG
jgi:phosphate/sulfate permease